MESLEYLTGTSNASQRHLSIETLKKYKITIGEEAFRMEDGTLKMLTVIYYPFFRITPNKILAKLQKEEKLKKENINYMAKNDSIYLDLCRIENGYEVVKAKVRGIGADYKQYQRFIPSGGDFGVFGWNTVTDKDRVIVITEGEFDAMAVHQVTNLPSISLPNGASNLPNNLIPMLEKFERIYLWMDNDEAGQINITNFATKLGVSRTYVIRPMDPKPNNLDSEPEGENSEDVLAKIKDANDALRKDPEFIKQMIKEARPIPSENLVQFQNLRDAVKNRIYNIEQNCGLKSNYFSWFNKIFKGFRRGELSIFTGPTGSGKTTFLSQLSLDFAQQGLPTLMCSFELKNEVLLSTMLTQYSGFNLSTETEKFDYYADRFEDFPLYFQTYFGSTEIEKILDIIEYGIYAYDIGHIVIDNLQFMLSGQARGGFERLELQDQMISKLRRLATEKNVHITLVIHPRKS